MIMAHIFLYYCDFDEVREIEKVIRETKVVYKTHTSLATCTYQRMSTTYK